MDTYASNPAGIRVQTGQFLKREGFSLLVVAIVIHIPVVPLAVFWTPWCWLGSSLWFAWLALDYIGSVRLMQSGDICPAKVISLDPGILAVYTDMSTRPDAAHPAIVVTEVSLKNLSGGKIKVGERLAVSCFYQGEPEFMDQHWTNLSVVEPVRAATANVQDVKRTLRSIEEELWQCLDTGLASSGNPSKPGVFFLQEGKKSGGPGVSEGRVLLVPGDDDRLPKAAAYARKTFRFFLRELSWEKRRIIPGLDFAAVKIAFSDPPELRSNHPNDLEREYMWVSEIEFDGQQIRGVLLNQPDSLKSYNEGDVVSVPPKQMVDWAYSVMGEVCGGFTIQMMRLGMDKKELKAHDDAWGMDFGVPGGIRLVPESYLPEEIKPKRSPLPELEGLFVHGLFKQVSELEHPMSVNMRESLVEQLQEDQSFLTAIDENGFTLLHNLAMGGSYDGVDVCLQFGANPNEVSSNGATALQLAKQLGWTKVVRRIQEAGGN